MIIPKENLIGYILNSDSALEKILNKKTLEKLRDYEAKIHQYPLSIVDNLFLDHQDGNKSLKGLSKNIGISARILTKIFIYYGLPMKTNKESVRQELYKRWKDPEFRKRNTEAVRENWKDPKFRERQAEGARKNWKDPEFRKRNAEGVRENWKDPEFRKRNAEGVRENWKDPEFRERHAKGARQELYKRWKDPEFRKRNAKGVRTARLNPTNLSKYKLPTFYGYRRDICFEAQSTWEANLARIFWYSGREYCSHERFDLDIPNKYKNLFGSDKTSVQIDFIVKNPRGKLVFYEIMAPPLEEEKDWAKLEMLVEQYSLLLKIITPKKYYKLEKYFKEKIQNSPIFCGWETLRDNVSINPEKYS